MQTGKLWRMIMVLVLLLAAVAPTAVFALENSGGKQDGTAVSYQHEDEHTEEEVVVQEGSSDGVGFVLTLIIGIIALIIFVVAILGAVGLGVIGIGYASVSPGEE
ncbi:MAG TPA: hypothetical protein PLD25_15415 [Chloroflexota bacterium]|nr:hypothetical protein [Chloroflexota bacterium]